jgi:putative peptidoglycan lipid II flippase
MKKQIQKYFRPISLKAASLVLMGASLISYLAGLFRDLILSYYFGAGEAADVYYTSFLVPDLIFNLTIAGVLGGVFIPLFRQKYLKDKQEAMALAGAFLVTSQLMVLVICVIAYFLMPFIAENFFGNASLDQQKDIILMSRIMLASPIIFALSNSLGSVLMSFKHYLSYALSPGLYNLGIIAGIYLFNEEYGIYSAVFGVIIGLILHLLIRFVDLWNLDFSFKFSFKADGLWEMYKLSIPKSLGLVFWQLSVWVYNIIGYSMVDGSIAAYNYARNIQSFAVSLFGIAVATAVFPFIVDSVEDGDKKKVVKKVEFSLLQILFFTIPAAVGLAVLSLETTNFLFARGNFDAKAVAITSQILFFFAFSIPFESSVHLLSRVFYAYKNTWIPVLVNLLFLVINTVAAFSLATLLGPQVFAISFSIGVIIQVLLLIILIRKYVVLNMKYLTFNVLKISFASLLMGLTIEAVKLSGLPITNLVFIGLILIGVAIYFVFAKFLGIIDYAGLDRFKIFKK